MAPPNKNVEGLVEILGRIRLQSDPDPELLLAFQARYLASTADEKLRFFDSILRRMEIQKSELEEHLRLLLEPGEVEPIQWSRRLTLMRRKLESPRLRAFRRFLNISGGLKFLLDLRADVLAARRRAAIDLEPLDEEIAHLFDSWFQHGFLFLQEITEDSPYRQIRFLKEHDMVHPMARLEEMGRRLGADRRCFALYHRAMPEEPVVYIEVALTHGMAHSIHQIIQKRVRAGPTKAAPDTAIFYSINNTQNGLAGLGLGKLLIFQVVDAIKKDHPDVKTFATLSPMPGFWEGYLQPILRGQDEPFVLKRARLGEFFSERAQREFLQHQVGVGGAAGTDFAAALLAVLSRPQWINDPVYAQLLEKPLSEIAYRYLTEEQDGQGKPLNSVANFHMGNGAKVRPAHVNFGANRSDRGLQESCGLMVNYMYSSSWLEQIRRTMESFLPWKS